MLLLQHTLKFKLYQIVQKQTQAFLIHFQQSFFFFAILSTVDFNLDCSQFQFQSLE